MKAGTIAAATFTLAMVVALNGCGSTTVRATNVRDGLTRASFPQYPLSFRYPAAWNRRDCPKQVSSFTATVTYLTTARPGNCGGGGWPVRRLGKNGVLVAWQAFGMPDWTRITKFPGRDTTIGGRPARIAVTSSHAPAPAGVSRACRRIGGTGSMEVAIEREAVDNWMLATVCLRGPDLGSGEAAVRQMLSTVRLR